MMTDNPDDGQETTGTASERDDAEEQAQGQAGRSEGNGSAESAGADADTDDADTDADPDGAERPIPAVSDVTELGGHGSAPKDTDTEEDSEEDEETRRARICKALESLVFVSDRVVTPQTLGKIVKLKSGEVKSLMAELIDSYADRGVQLVEVSGGYQFRSAPDCSDYVREMVSQKPVRLTRAQLETLALVSYRQPITRPEIDDVRGVDTGSAVKVLLERGLIKMLGRKDEAGRPMLYGTTPYFLEFFGLKTLRDLPTLKEFTDLSEENRTLFKRKTGEAVEDAEAQLAEQAAEGEAVTDAEEAFDPSSQGPDGPAGEGSQEQQADENSVEDGAEPPESEADDEDDEDDDEDFEAHDGVEPADMDSGEQNSDDEDDEEDEEDMGEMEDDVPPEPAST